MGKSASAVRKRRPVRVRPKNLVSLHKKSIQRVSPDACRAPARTPLTARCWRRQGAHVKEGAKREGSGILPVEQVWDRRKTLKENYASIGLNAGFNTKINTFTGEMTDAMARRIQGLGDVPFDSEEEDEEEEPPAAPPTAAVQALERAAEEVQAHNATVGPRMTGGERKFVEALLQAHGTNYKAMAKDIKRNRSQETAGNLRRKVERYARLAQVSVQALCEKYSASSA